ncbi:MAG: hypothetical protein AB1414_01920 [bacterium]
MKHFLSTQLQRISCKKNHQTFEPNFAIFEQNKQIDKDSDSLNGSLN